jgi:hypothetical protein
MSDETHRSDPVPMFVKTDVGRRALLQSLAAGAGLGIAAPALAADHPMAHALENQARVTAADRRARAAAYKPEFLDKHLFDTLVVLSDQVVPGSKATRAAEFIDALLAVESPESQKRFLQSIGALEGLAIAEHRKAWKMLSAAEATALLTKASTADVKAPLRRSFDQVKGWIAGAYYSSEAGMKDLGWTGAMMFPALPACGSSAPSAE